MIKVNYDKITGKVVGFNLDATPFIEITEEQRKQPLPDKYSYYAVINNEFKVVRREPTEEEIIQQQISEISKRLMKIKDWFSENDWKINKIVIGEWEESDSRWQEYLTERQNIRNEQDMLNLKLSQVKGVKAV